jgi:hypothetical protein
MRSRRCGTWGCRWPRSRRCSVDGEAAPERIIGQQILALDQQIRQATELRERLALLQALSKGQNPRLEDWVQSLSLMATFGRYFEPAS